MSVPHNDIPSFICKLKREEWRNRIIQNALFSSAPKVMAVHGTWGTGKTSLLYQAYHELGGRQNYFQEKDPREKVEGKKIDLEKRFNLPSNSKIVPIWFEAWQYQHEPNILAAMLKEIREQVETHYKIWGEIKEFSTVTLETFLNSIDLTFKATAGVFEAGIGISNLGDNAEKSIKDYQARNFSSPMSSVIMKKNLEQAIDQLLYLDVISKGQEIISKIFNRKKDDPERKVIIFIDDLDRCMPGKALEIFEAIKVYLNLNNCVFVLGMDLHEVEKMLVKYWGNDSSPDKLKFRARLYMEKICQDIYHLPFPTVTQRADYFDHLLKEQLTGLSKLKIRGSSGLKSIFVTVKSIANTFNFLPPIPRSIKIFANVLISYISKPGLKEWLNEEGANDENLKKVLVIAYLYAFHFDLYQMFALYPDFYQNLAQYCKGEPLSEDLNKQLEMLTLPQVKDKEYLFEGEIPNMQMFPYPNLRQVFWIRALILDSDPILEDDRKYLIL